MYNVLLSPTSDLSPTKSSFDFHKSIKQNPEKKLFLFFVLLSINICLIVMNSAVQFNSNGAFETSIKKSSFELSQVQTRVDQLCEQPMQRNHRPNRSFGMDILGSTMGRYHRQFSVSKRLRKCRGRSNF